ncbi:MAG TPA: site-2 protease family protein [bacterium]|nr:site-2 protease family protein [bacterium]
MATDAQSRFAAIHDAVASAFPVRDFGVEEGRPVFTIIPGTDDKARFLRLRRDLEPLGVLPLLRRRGGDTVVLLGPKPPATRVQWSLPVALFGATLVSTFFAGLLNARGDLPGQHVNPVTSGLAFSLSLMAILFCHEMGHKLVSIWRGIDASLPYFIPVPPIIPGLAIGTMGAIIFTRAPAPNRDALVELGASGPIAGFIAAIPVLIYGVAHSSVVAGGAALAHTCRIPTPQLVDFLISWILRPDPSAEVIIHPVLFAGWIGLLVTAINLLPGGMLDGGHVVRALFGPRAHLVISLAAAGIAVYFRYYLMGVLILLLARRGHPGPLDDCSPLTTRHLLLAGAVAVIFALSAVPVTFSCQ